MRTIIAAVLCLFILPASAADFETTIRPDGTVEIVGDPVLLKAVEVCKQHQKKDSSFTAGFEADCAEVMRRYSDYLQMLPEAPPAATPAQKEEMDRGAVNKALAK